MVSEWVMERAGPDGAGDREQAVGARCRIRPAGIPGEDAASGDVMTAGAEGIAVAAAGGSGNPSPSGVCDSGVRRPRRGRSRRAAPPYTPRSAASAVATISDANGSPERCSRRIHTEVVPGHFVPEPAAVFRPNDALASSGTVALQSRSSAGVTSWPAPVMARALRGQQDGTARGVEPGPVDVVAGDVVVEAEGVAQHLQAEAFGAGPEVFRQAQGAGPAVIVRGQDAGEAGQEGAVEDRVVGGHQLGPEIAYRRLQSGEGLVEAGLSLDVAGREVMDGRGGRGDGALRIDQAGVEGLERVVPAGGGVDAEADRGDLDDAVLLRVEPGGLDVDGEGMKGWHGGGSFRTGAGPDGRGAHKARPARASRGCSRLRAGRNGRRRQGGAHGRGRRARTDAGGVEGCVRECLQRTREWAARAAGVEWSVSFVPPIPNL